MDKLPVKIKALRKKLWLSQQGFAVELEVTTQTVSRWERGISQPQIRQMLRLKKLGLST